MIEGIEYAIALRLRDADAGVDDRDLDRAPHRCEEGHAGVFAVVGYDGTCQPVCTSIGCTGCGPLARSVLLELRLPPAP